MASYSPREIAQQLLTACAADPITDTPAFKELKRQITEDSTREELVAVLMSMGQIAMACVTMLADHNKIAVDLALRRLLDLLDAPGAMPEQ